MLIRPPFKKVGHCLKRGNCCHYVLVPEAKGFLGKLFYFWNTQILGFYRRKPEVYESLKPCPCCGNKATGLYDKLNNVIKIACRKCGIKVEKYMFGNVSARIYKIRAIAVWNKRTQKL